MKIQRSIAMGLTLALITFVAQACSKGGNSTPTATFQTFYNAVKNTDVNAIKSVMPKKTLEQAESDAKAKGIAFDDDLKVELKRISTKLPATMPEIRNEKIEGDRATLEFRDGEDWEKVGFIKEDDGWKLRR
jgi:hypothetical protein